MDLYQQFIHQSRYARYDYGSGRRETLEETIDRYFDFFLWHLRVTRGHVVDPGVARWLKAEVRSLGVLPSLRALMTAGPALERSHVAGYNCAASIVDDTRVFDEALYILMCGTGIGPSVEGKGVAKLPQVPVSFIKNRSRPIVVADSKEGWARAFRELIESLYSGTIPGWDVSGVRPSGSPLRTFGGRASGPEPLERLFRFTIKIFIDAAGRRLRPVEVADIMCLVGDIVVVGGVRRAAEIILSDLDDEEMRFYKSGEWWKDHPYRQNANISTIYEGRPDRKSFALEWEALRLSDSGERGLFNREAARQQALKYRRRNSDWDFITNPCGEINLRSNQFCNLSNPICRKDDDRTDIERKVKAATIFGTWQATLTRFPYLRDVWCRNTEEERLLGVGLGGIVDSDVARDADERLLGQWRETAVDTNRDWARLLGIPAAAAITCVKPDGNSSQLVNAASGLHARRHPHYLRRVRQDTKDPLTRFMRDAGVPFEPCKFRPAEVGIFAFPIEAPEGAVTRHDQTALEQLEIWLKIKRGWTEHNPSITVSVHEHEWTPVSEWVWDNFDEVQGISFLPHDGGVYEQAPYEDLTPEQYRIMKAEMPENLDWSNLRHYEEGDQTVGAQTLACTAGVCELV